MDSLPSETARVGLVRDALRRRWIAVVAFAIAAAIAAGVIAWAMPERYTSTVRVMLTPVLGNPLAPDSARSGDQINVAMQTEAGLIGSPPVAELVGDDVGTPVESSDSRVVATVLANTQIIEISYTAATADDAAGYANAYARALLASRQDKAESEIESQLAVMEQQQSAALAGLKQASVDASADGSLEANGMVQLYTNRLATLQEGVGELEAAPTSPGSVISPEELPSSSDGLSVPLLVLGGLVVGLLLGMIVAVYREWTDDRLRVEGEYSIGEIPIIGVVEESPSDRLEPDDVYRLIRASLLASQAPPSTVALVGIDAIANALLPGIATRVGSALEVAGYRTRVLEGGDASNGPIASRSGEGVAVARGDDDYLLVCSSTSEGSEVSEGLLAGDCVVLVAAEGVSTGHAIERAAARADRFGVRVVGVIAVRRTERRRRAAGRDRRTAVVADDAPESEPQVASSDSTSANGGENDERIAESSDAWQAGR